MKRAFIRALWGVSEIKPEDKTEGWINPEARRKKIDEEIELILKNPYTVPFITYVFGLENYEHLIKMGLNTNGYQCVMVNESPVVWDLQKQFWRHKLDIIKKAMQEDGYDEIVYLDWDCVPVKPLFPDIWERLAKKDSIQANLQFYKRRKCLWRDIDWRKTSNGGFLYIRDKEISNKLISIWEDFPPEFKFWDEVCISKLTDEMLGGWKGSQAYWEHFEPEVCNLKKNSVFEDAQIVSKDFCFFHYVQSANNKSGKNYMGKTGQKIEE